MKTICLLGSRTSLLNLAREGNQSEENIVEEVGNNALYEENDDFTYEEHKNDDGDDSDNDPGSNANGHDFRQHCF